MPLSMYSWTNKLFVNASYSMVIYLLMWSSLSNLAWPTSVPLPSCSNVSVTCALGCLEVPISLEHTNGYLPNNTFCIDSSSLATYQLQGCPQSGFYDLLQETRGVCTASGSNGTDLYLTANKLEPGFHQFKCLNGITISTIVGDDDLLYRDIQFYINGMLRGSYDSTNVTLDVGDNFTATVIAVGNVSVINASDPHFICKTHFACNVQTRRDLENRYTECSLSAPVSLSDDGRTLTIMIGDTEVITIGIMVNDGAVLSPSISTPWPTTTVSVDGQSTATVIESVITSTSIDYSNVNIKPTATHTIMNTTSTSSLSIDQTPSLTSQGTPTSPRPPSDEESEGVAGYVIITIAVIVVIIAAVLVGAVAYYAYTCKRSHVRKKKSTERSTERNTEEAVSTSVSYQMASSSSSSSSRRSSVEADKQQKHMNENFKELHDKMDHIGSKVDHIGRKVDSVDDKVDHSREITEQCNTSVSTLMVNYTNSLKRQTSAQ